MEIRLSKCVLRSWALTDIESLVLHANNKKVWRNVRDLFPHPYTPADAVWWIKHTGSRQQETHFAIAVDGKAVGAIGFDIQEDIFRRSAEIGYWLGERFWGRGITTEAVTALTEYAFDNFDLCRLYAGVFEWNPGSMRVLEKAGYELEARLRRAVTKDGQTIDEIIYAKIREL